MTLFKITKERYDEIRKIYFLWKELNSKIKETYTRGVNLHEAITETVCCYVNGFHLSIGSGSEDALNPSTQELIQIKGTSNWNSDLTSFGPNSIFDHLHFVRLNQDEDKMYLYDIPTETLNNIMVNRNDTFKDFQNQGKRPRFSIINKYIKKYDIKEYAIVNLITGEIIKK